MALLPLHYGIPLARPLSALSVSSVFHCLVPSPPIFTSNTPLGRLLISGYIEPTRTEREGFLWGGPGAFMRSVSASHPTPNLPRSTLALAAVAVAFLFASTISRRTHAAIDPLSGIDFVTIGATYGGAGNPAYQSGVPNRVVNGRGSVGYEYNIGRMEVTTAQWVEFFNAAYDRPASERIPFLFPPDFWGAAATAPTTPGGLRWTVPAGNELRPVGNISWRMAAIYCNWLCNGKSLDRSAFLNGAYDVSTF